MRFTVDHLTALLPHGDPLRRLELFIAMEAVIGFMQRMPGQYVTMTIEAAPRVQMAAKMAGITLPLLAIRSAIERLIRAVNAPQTNREAAQ